MHNLRIQKGYKFKNGNIQKTSQGNAQFVDNISDLQGICLLDFDPDLEYVIQSTGEGYRIKDEFRQPSLNFNPILTILDFPIYFDKVRFGGNTTESDPVYLAEKPIIHYKTDILLKDYEANGTTLPATILGQQISGQANESVTKIDSSTNQIQNSIEWKYINVDNPNYLLEAKTTALNCILLVNTDNLGDTIIELQTIEEYINQLLDTSNQKSRTKTVTLKNIGYKGNKCWFKSPQKIDNLGNESRKLSGGEADTITFAVDDQGNLVWVITDNVVLPNLDNITVAYQTFEKGTFTLNTEVKSRYDGVPKIAKEIHINWFGNLATASTIEITIANNTNTVVLQAAIDGHESFPILIPVQDGDIIQSIVSSSNFHNVQLEIFIK